MKLLQLTKLDKLIPGFQLNRMPYSIRVLLANALTNYGRPGCDDYCINAILEWSPTSAGSDIAFYPARVVLQDFTGVPVITDLAGLRTTVAERGGNPEAVEPSTRCQLVIDHSVQVDHSGTPQARGLNWRLEVQRNRDRYELMRWAATAFRGIDVTAPTTGIVHQVNLEYHAEVVSQRDGWLLPDTCIGTDSHTTMVNGLGVLGTGVGGIEATVALLNQPYSISLPQVVGVRLTGELRSGVSATDLVLTVTEMLRRKGVVDKFVEFCGPALRHLKVEERVTLANMAPEYGATIGYFPIDAQTMSYLRRTGRREGKIQEAHYYAQHAGLFAEPDAPEPLFSALVELDLSTVNPSLAGPARPQDRVDLGDLWVNFKGALVAPKKANGYDLPAEALDRSVKVTIGDRTAVLGHGSVVLAAITSCTNTSNPWGIVQAALVARNAVERGLTVPPYVKTSLAPGSRVVEDYLQSAGLQGSLDALGFHIVGFGCTTCIGNSGPLLEGVEKAIKEGDLVACAVISGNRNFAGRVQSSVRGNYLASPALVVAFALTGRVDVDLTSEPVGMDPDGAPVFLSDLMPTDMEVDAIVTKHLRREMFTNRYSADSLKGPVEWQQLDVPEGKTWQFDPSSTYIQRPPWFESSGSPFNPIFGARALGFFGDSITTDHISPAGSIKPTSPAGQYLIEHGVSPADFNSYGARRGAHEVMMRGTFDNPRLRNRLTPGDEGNHTVYLPDGEIGSFFDVSQRYADDRVPLIIIAGKEYGTGSSRDWAAKGPKLLGVRAVIAESYERIHRSNLIGMGIRPLQFVNGETADLLGLTGEEVFDIEAWDGSTRQDVVVRWTNPKTKANGAFDALLRVDTASEAETFAAGGILPQRLKQILEPTVAG
ncbi:MAG: aconitate hydratase AcnA [Deltaproteobacteria bacterium]|nr:aconitate hydratase AcnA [Deltaproteobacteria bacterium]